MSDDRKYDWIRDNHLTWQCWWDHDLAEWVVDLLARDEGNPAVWSGRGVTLTAAATAAYRRWQRRGKG